MLGVDSDRAPMALHDRATDGKAEPGPAGVAAAGTVHATETLEDQLTLIRRDAGAVVGDSQRRHPGAFVQRHLHDGDGVARGFER